MYASWQGTRNGHAFLTKAQKSNCVPCLAQRASAFEAQYSIPHLLFVPLVLNLFNNLGSLLFAQS